MPLTLMELLQPQVIVDTISQITTGQGHASQFMGFSMNSGSKIRKVPTRYASYRIVNSTREPASFRAPGTGPAVIPPNPIGERRVAMSRMHEKIILDAEMLGNLAKIDGPNSQIDTGGAQYIAAQKALLAEKFNKSVEYLTAGFFRGQFFLQQSGDNWVPYLTNPGSGTVMTVDLGLPAANKSQLNLLGAGNVIDVSWDNPEAPIVEQMLKIRAAFVQLTGMPLKCVLMNSVMFSNVINNTQVRTVGGVVQTPYESFTYKDGKESRYAVAGMGMATLRALPWLEIILIDDVLSIGGTDPIHTTGTGTLTKVIPDTAAVFMPEPDSSWAQMWHGGEWVAEDYGWKKMEMKQGFSAWSRYDIEPTICSIVALLNALPVAYRTTAWAYGTVVF